MVLGVGTRCDATQTGSCAHKFPKLTAVANLPHWAAGTTTSGKG